MKITNAPEAQQKCALCNIQIDQYNASSEHIIPNAIGGRKVVLGFLCRDCNSDTGVSWDNELVNQLAPICNLLNIKRQRGKPPTQIFEDSKGQRFRRQSDGNMSIDQVMINEYESEDKKTVQITAPNLRELKRHLPGLIRRFPTLAEMDVQKHAAPTSKYSKNLLAINLTFGGIQAGKSIVKSCVALAHNVGIQIDKLEIAKEYLCSGSEPCFGYYNEYDPVSNRPENTFFHCVYVQGNKNTGEILGYVEYFGYQRIVVLLSREYGGPSFSSCYAVDPVAGKEIHLDISLPNFTEQEVEEIYDYKKIDYSKCKAAVESLLQFYTNESSRLQRTKEIRQAVDYAFDNCGAKQGEKLSPEQKQLIIDLILERITPYIQHLADLQEINFDEDITEENMLILFQKNTENSNK